jgi:polygalacturonase
VPQFKYVASGSYVIASDGTGVGPVGYQVSVTSRGWSGSVVFAQNIAPPGSVPNYVNVAYQDANTGTEFAAGVAITGTAAIIISPTVGDLIAIVTVTTGEVIINVNPATQGVTNRELRNAFVAAGYDTAGQDTTEAMLSVAVAGMLGQVLDVRAFGAKGDGVTDDTAAIQRAVTASANGTLLFPSGYTFAITDDIEVASPITIIGYGATLLQTVAAKTGITVSSSDVTIEGLRVRGTQYATIQSSEYGIRCEAASYAAAIERIRIINCRVDRWGYEAIRLRWVRDFEVSGCTLEQLFYAGVLMWGAEDGRIVNNYIDDIPGTPNGYGITATRDNTASLVTDPVTSRVVISGNTITNIPVWTGIDTHGGQDLVISNNTLHDVKKPIWCVAQDSGVTPTFAPKRITITGNVMTSGVTDNSFDEGIVVDGAGGGVGSVVDYAERIVVANNVITGYGSGSTLSAGIYIRYVRGVAVRGNFVSEASQNGVILVNDCLDVSITDNVFQDLFSNSAQAKAVRVQNDNCTGYIAGNSFSRASKSATFVNNVGVEVISGALNCNIVIGENDWSRAESSPAIDSNSAMQGIKTVTSTYAVLAQDRTILADATAGAFDVDLPNAVGNFGRILTIKKVDASGNAVSVDPSGSQLIDGSSSSYSLPAQWDGVTIQSNGVSWFILGIGP